MAPPKKKQQQKQQQVASSSSTQPPNHLSDEEMKDIIDSLNKPKAKGKFGEVFTDEAKLVAIKRTSRKDGSAYAQYQKEKETLTTLGHDNDNIIKLLGTHETKEHGYIFLEYCPNTLQKAIEDQQLKLVEVNAIAIGLAKALQVLHRNKMAHCDIKPPNIMLNTGNNVKLIDFGAVTKFGQDVAVGTEGYYKEGERKASETRDAYAYGVTLLQLLRFQTEPITAIGKSKSQSIREYVLDHQKGSQYIAPKLYKENDTLADDLGNLALSCTSGTPSARPTMKLILEELSGGKKSNRKKSK